MNGPPFDGIPCPMCPLEIRGLAAVAHNLCWRLKDAHLESPCIISAKFHSLKRAVRLVDEVKAITEDSPMELRRLREVAWEMDGCETINELLSFKDELQKAVDAVQILSDKHFSNKMHAHGRL